MHGIITPSWHCNPPMLYSLLHVVGKCLQAPNVKSCHFVPCHSCGLIVELGLLQISPFKTNVTQVTMHHTITKICCPSIKFGWLCMILLKTSYSMKIIMSQPTNWGGIICVHPLSYLLNSFSSCCIALSIGIAKRTLLIVFRVAQGVNAPFANDLPTIWII